jgi:hypothetical protein
MKNILFALVLLVSINCIGQDCKSLPKSFSSYQQAIALIKGSKFQLKQSANTSSSSWMASSNYYSCDGETGYFLYTTNRGYEYIHKGVPLSVWNSFKAASSKGSYYDHNIKGKYQLMLN